MSHTGNPEIALRPLRKGDAAQLASLANNKKIADCLRDVFPYPYSEGDALSFITLCLEEDPQMNFGITVDSKLAGVIGLILQPDIYRISAEAGYWLGEDFWGRGVATAALKLLIAYAFDTLKLAKLFSGVFSTNRASVRVLEKCGFEQEGLFKRSLIKNGILLDEYRYGLINLDYKGEGIGIGTK
jgi:RimJ/RimL family protein N-acetyltransferase